MTAHRGIRYRPDTGWEMRCDRCTADKVARFWPLDREFWDPKRGLSRCRACWNAYERSARKHRQRTRQRSVAILAYQRDWAARKRAQQRADEGREKYQRKAA